MEPVLLVQVECSPMVHRGEGGDAAALTFTAIQELFVVTGLEANAEPQRSEVGTKFHPRWRSLCWRRQRETAAEVWSVPACRGNQSLVMYKHHPRPKGTQSRINIFFFFKERAIKTDRYKNELWNNSLGASSWIMNSNHFLVGSRFFFSSFTRSQESSTLIVLYFPARSVGERMSSVMD